MEWLGRWLWRRWKHRFLAAFTVALLVVGQAIVIPALVLGALIFELNGLESLVTVGGASMFYAAGTAGAIRIIGKPQFAAIASWAKDEESDPSPAWAAAFAIPRDVLVPTFTALVAPYVAVTTAIFKAVSSEPWPAYALVAVSALITFVSAAGTTAVSAELTLRPVREQVAVAPGMSSQSPSPGWRTRPRLMFAVGLATFSGVTFGGSLAPYLDPVAGRLFLIIVAGLAVAATNVVIANLLLLAPILRPISDLQITAQRVARGEFDGVIPVTSNDEFGELVVTFNRMQDGLQERERLRTAFGSYVDPQLAERLLEQPNELFEGEEVDVTIMFVDIRGFTEYSERVAPREVVGRLNELFGLAVPILHAHRGHANKYSGDGVLAAFGVPWPLPDHADRAVAAALRLQAEVAARFGSEVRIGIGINSGQVIAGTVGGGGKLEFTLIGDPVNVASRVEQLTKQTGDPILITQATFDLLAEGPFDAVPRGAHREGKDRSHRRLRPPNTVSASSVISEGSTSILPVRASFGSGAQRGGRGLQRVAQRPAHRARPRSGVSR